MPILPIDLQTLFSQLNQVGKEQAVQKEVPPLAQSLQASEIVKKTEAADNSVNQTREVEQGAEKVKNEKEGGHKRKASEKEKKKKEGRAVSGRPCFEDPNLGHHVNLVG